MREWGERESEVKKEGRKEWFRGTDSQEYANTVETP